MFSANATWPDGLCLQRAKWRTWASRCCSRIRLTLKIDGDTNPNSADSPKASAQIRQNGIPSRLRHVPYIFGKPPFGPERPAGYPKKARPDSAKEIPRSTRSEEH